MNEMSGAEAMVRMLQLYGVEHIFGLCGDTSLPFYDALFRTGQGIQHILTRDERSAAYMADGYARVTGRVGVCEGPSGGGATYILPGIVEANESSIAVLGITTDIAVGSRGRFALTELDQKTLFSPLTKWNNVIERSALVPSTVRDAFRAMTTGRPGAAHIGFPFDVQNGVVSDSELWAQQEHSSFPAWRIAPNPDAVERAANALLQARLPVFVIGGGVVISGAESELTALATALNAPVATTISGQGSLPDTHDLCLGVVGSNGGTPATRSVVDAADLVVFVGCRAGSVTTERWRHPDSHTKIIHIDVDPAVISANYRTEVALLGDAKLALAALLEIVSSEAAAGESRCHEGTQRVKRAKAEKNALYQKLAESCESPIRPERIVAELNKVLPRDAIIVADPGTPCPYISAYYEFQETGRHFISNRAHGALGYALSAAVGAWFGRPSARCVAVMGDGSFAFTVGELETITRLKVPILIIVLSNDTFSWIKAGQKTNFSSRYYSVDFSTTNHAKVARAYGLRAWRVEDPDELPATLAAAAECGEPCLVDIVTQPLHDAEAPVSEWIA